MRERRRRDIPRDKSQSRGGTAGEGEREGEGESGNGNESGNENVDVAAVVTAAEGARTERERPCIDRTPTKSLFRAPII